MKRAARYLGQLVRVSVWGGLASILLYLAYTLVTPYRYEDLPPLKDGDIVFQTINTSQTLAIMFATHSVYSHVGVVEMRDGKPMVIEAVGPVRVISLDKWVNQGMRDRVAIARVDGLTAEQGKATVAAAKAYLGKPYDFYFLDDEKRIYCSELVYKAFQKGAGIPVGTVEKVGDLSVDNFFVRDLIRKRWHNYPPCDGQKSFDACYATVMQQSLVSPVSLERDEKVKLIYSNYGLTP
ncbi:MAG: peptidoglycan peptidase [Azospirillum brasilense]|nr:MAG: peptidoglycan peptidase [Azospirillum brasilense]